MSDQVPPGPAGYADDAHRYRLDSRIASGGMGEVWLATDETLHRQVAVKLLKNELADDGGFRSRFETEARNAARLQHPGVAGVFDYGETAPRDGSPTPRPFLVMEYVDGQPLSDLLRPDAPMPPEVAVPLLAQAADAIGAAHAAGIVHRDVKPANLLVTRDRTMKITDFGIARAADGVALTQTGQVMGTPQYLAPEQAEGKQATPASDVYSLACVAYECLVGRRPFTGESSVAIALAHLREPVPELPGTLPPDLAAVVRRALAKDPAERYADGAELAAALRDPGSARGAAPGAGGAGAAAAGLAGAAGAAGLAAAAQSGDGRPEDATSVIPATGATPVAGPGLDAPPARRPAPPPPTQRTTVTEERQPERRKKGVPGWLPGAVLGAAALVAILVLVLIFGTGDDDGSGDQPDRRPTQSEQTDDGGGDEQQDPEQPQDTGEPPAPEPSDDPPAEEPSDTPEEPSDDPTEPTEPTGEPSLDVDPTTGLPDVTDEADSGASSPADEGTDPAEPDAQDAQDEEGQQ